MAIVYLHPRTINKGTRLSKSVRSDKSSDSVDIPDKPLRKVSKNTEKPAVKKGQTEVAVKTGAWKKTEIDALYR